MNYTEMCGRILNLSLSINDVFMIDTQSRLLAFKVRDEEDLDITEDQFAERLEDLAFIASACKHHERFYDELEYIEISYKNRSSAVFPIGSDKILVICRKKKDMDIHQLAMKVSEIVHAKTQIIED
jgi:predicted regulator of Ras-like GTPase activity (Roadblock/LC7/MglB family)